VALQVTITEDMYLYRQRMLIIQRNAGETVLFLTRCIHLHVLSDEF